ncbi:MAG: NAD-dependent epimerase/dehydratase family protein [Sphingopyxis sp.]
MAGTVFVSGGSGYIAGFLIRQLVSEGWMVHTSIRNLAKESQVRETLQVDNTKLSFFAADLINDAGWAEAMAGCSHVAHVASPLPANAPKHEDELIVPARDGALRALRAAKAAGVKRFVMTSSMAAIAYGHGPDKRFFTEADWTNVTSPDAYPYVKSKAIAERAARDWVAAEGGGIEYCTVNPSLVLGPLQSGDFSASLEAIMKLLDGSLPGLPNFGFGVVDVRDVADMHVRCLNAPDMAGERFICSGPFVMMKDVAATLKAGLGEQARKVPSRAMPNWLLRVAALFDPVVRQVLGELGKVRESPADHARDKLGWIPRPPEETILDTARDMIRLGLVKV